jgi:hypothetical protein
VTPDRASAIRGFSFSRLWYSGLVPAPIVLTPEQKNQALDLAVEGKTLGQIHAALGVGAAVFWRERQKDPDFSLAFTRAREEAAHLVADRALTVVEEYADPARARIMLDAIRWHTSKRLPHVYGERLDVNLNHTVDIGGALADARRRAALPASDPNPEILFSEARPSAGLEPAALDAPPVEAPNGAFDAALECPDFGRERADSASGGPGPALGPSDAAAGPSDAKNRHSAAAPDAAALDCGAGQPGAGLGISSPAARVSAGDALPELAEDLF